MPTDLIFTIPPRVGKKETTQIKLSENILDTPQIVKTNIEDIVVSKGFIGITEKNNKVFSDAALETMLKVQGFSKGAAWCMFYVKAVLYQTFPFDRDWLDTNWTGLCTGNWNQTVKRNRQGDLRYLTIQTQTPQIGDVVIFTRADGGHTGIITKVFSPTEVQTVEGNTNYAGSREGDGVYIKKRTVVVNQKSGGLKCVGFIRRAFTENERTLLKYDAKEKNFYFDFIKSETNKVVGNVFKDLGKSVVGIGGVGKSLGTSIKKAVDPLIDFTKKATQKK